ncbi:glycoside hydrolase family 20 protein [Wenyingzhuangia sp. IMCC45467]
MSKYKQILVLTLLVIFSACTKPKTFTESDIHITPKPVSLKLEKGNFKFSKNTQFHVTNAEQKEIAYILIQKFQKSAGITLITNSRIPTENYITFKTNPDLKKEAYELNVTEDYVEIIASSHAGFLYGMETLRQLLPEEIESTKLESTTKWVIPTLTIKDEPRFSHRGLMLDIARHFFNKEYILKTIDRLSMHKMNVLHLHLQDDQGWRIEIKKYPKLTEVGGWRVDQEDKAWNSREINDPNEKGTYGGFLTQEELKEIVAYAATKNIQVIPEIEMPAHVSSAIAAYPELSCKGVPIGVPSGGVWPITDIYCPGKEITFEFLEDVLTEVMDIFPSKYIHIGGDEATKTNWKTCPHCKKRIQQEGLKNVDELQSYMITRMEKFVNAKGRKIIGWDEILEGGLAPDATVMSWRGTKGGIEATKQGHDVIMTPESHCYLNFYQGPQNEEPKAFNAYTPLNKVYEFDPVVEGMTPEQAEHVLGGQANLWAEFITSNELSEYMLFPRLSALAETLWSPKEARDWSDFSARIPFLFKRFDYLNINYSKSAYLITAKSSVDINTKKVYLTLQNEFPNPDIRYVLGDQDIYNNAIKYNDSIQIDDTTVLKASLFKDNQPVGKVFVDTIKFHKAVGSNITFKKPFNSNYRGDGPLSLVNIIRGSKNFHDGQWQAWLVDDMEAVIDLGNEKEITQITVGTLESQGSGIYYPTAVKVLVSNNGKDYKQVGEIARTYKANPNVELLNFNIEFKSTKAKYVKIIAKNLKETPEGGNTWLFVDEILVN